MLENPSSVVFDNEEASATSVHDVAASSLSVGLSNTPCITYLLDKLNVCIDWLKVRIPVRFSPNDDVVKKLFDVFRLKADEFDGKDVSEGRGRRVYDEGTTCIDATPLNEQQAGFPYFYLDMSGRGCRSFELRGGNWLELFNTIALIPDYHVSRIDVAIDDFSGLITPEKLKYRIFRKLYVTKLRTYKVMHNGDRCLTEEPEIIDSQDSGFTATFGGRQSKQLCMYNKKAERAAANYDVIVDSWMRYEARFMHSSGNNAFQEIHTGLMNDSIQSVISGMVRGLVEFKENNNFDDNNSYKASIWSLWEQVLQSASKITVKNQAKHELSMAMKASWLAGSAGPTLGQVALVDPGNFMNFIGKVVSGVPERLTHKQVQVVNKMRAELGLSCYTLEEAQKELSKSYNTFKDGNKVTNRLLRSYIINQDTGEVSVEGE